MTAQLRDVSAPTVAEGALPPHDLGAEAAVLTSIILKSEGLIKCSDFLKPEHFYSGVHRQIFDAILRLFYARKPIDIETIASNLVERQRYAEVGGKNGIEEMINSVSAVMNVRAYALTVHDCWRRRQVILECDRARATGYGAVADTQAFCDATTKLLASIGLQNPAAPTETMKDALERLLTQLHTRDSDSATHGNVEFVPTGIYSLDKIILGLARRKVVTVAAERGGGKTALAMQAAMHVAEGGVGVLFFSGEVMSREMTRRMVAHKARVSNQKLKTHRPDRMTLSNDEMVRVLEASNLIKDLPIRFVYKSRITIEEVRSVAEAYRDESMMIHHVPLGLVVLDYLQRVAPSGRMAERKEHEQIKHNAFEFKTMADELDVAGLALAQANKPTVQGRKVTRSTYGSGAIEKESDVVIYIVPEGEHAADAEVRDMTLELTKQRDGVPEASIPVRYHGPTFTFEDPNAPSTDPSRQYVDGFFTRP